MKLRRLLLIPAGLLAVYFGLPALLRRLGLHPHYHGKRYHFPDKKALVITTSHDTLLESGKPTGVWASEMTVPYYEFLDAKMQVDVASIQGGNIPLEKPSIRWPMATDADKRFLSDPDFLHKAENSLKIDDIDFTEYDLVYIAGGWGAAYDLGPSAVLGEKTTAAYANGAVMGAVCHGVLGFLQTNKEDGTPLLQGLKATGVTDQQIRELGITETPQHPETELRRAGVNFRADEDRPRAVLGNLTVVDGRIVTGQNQNAGAETAQKMMAVLQSLQN
ncbi:MAG: type 1 glutamine amidotransferase domain-containing protein [Chloroflexota bacterium]